MDLSGYQFEVRPADVDEDVLPGESPPDYVARLAETKAKWVGADIHDDAVVAADTTVADGDQILGKPVDAAHAEQMLRLLRGRVHQVFTAIAVFQPVSDQIIVDVCRTDVPMRKYSDDEMRQYIESGDPLDKAGSYAIQHQGFNPVEGLTGCFANVVGLPLCHLQRTLKQFSIEPASDNTAVCKMAFNYDCPSYQEILQNCD